MKKIYAVVTLYVVDEEIKRERTVGWFHDREEAIRCVKENWGDIYECCYYNYALVEKVCEGLYNICDDGRSEDWFYVKPEPLKDDDRYITQYNVKETEKPYFLDKVINFSMG